MKRIGLLGGMSWESSIEYERLINTAVRDRLGGTSSADLIIRSYNFADIEELQEQGRWEDAASILAADAARMESGGAEVIALCTNTMHMVAEAIESATSVEFVHIGDATASAVTAAGCDSVALLGTRYTMEQSFYRDRLATANITTMVPDEPDRSIVHSVIFDELVQGVISNDSREAFGSIIDRLHQKGAQGVIAGCTEIELLVRPTDIDLPYFPSTALHVEAIVEASLN